jgi:hypothetical protein
LKCLVEIFASFSDECSSKGGTSAGTCANGFGVCCTCEKLVIVVVVDVIVVVVVVVDDIVVSVLNVRMNSCYFSYYC